MVITINEFPTHIEKTDNKYAPNKFIKLNNQSIYNSNLNRFARNIVMKNLHVYLEDQIKPYVKKFNSINTVFPVCIELEIHTVINHGSISLRKGKTCWKPAKDEYVPNWDIENLASIWIKALNDTLSRMNILEDDNVSFVDCIGYKFIPVDRLEDRKLIIKIDED